VPPLKQASTCKLHDEIEGHPDLAGVRRGCIVATVIKI
jgi:hypothetical protein